MHNLHLAVIIATTPEDACNLVEDDIEDWGNENNWRTICGCVSEDNKVYIHDDGGRFPPKENATIETINKMTRAWMGVEQPGIFNTEGRTEAEKHMQRHLNGEQLKHIEWYAIERYAEHMGAVVTTKSFSMEKNKEFSVLKHTFKEWNLDECSVTSCISTAEEITEGEKRYVVFIDMHS